MQLLVTNNYKICVHIFLRTFTIIGSLHWYTHEKYASESLGDKVQANDVSHEHHSDFWTGSLFRGVEPRQRPFKLSNNLLRHSTP